MSDHRSRAGHDAHTDARNEHAAKQRTEALLVLEERARETALLAEHEADLRRVENDRWWRRIQALLPCTWDRPSDDFDGCVE